MPQSHAAVFKEQLSRLQEVYRLYNGEFIAFTMIYSVYINEMLDSFPITSARRSVVVASLPSGHPIMLTHGYLLEAQGSQHAVASH